MTTANPFAGHLLRNPCLSPEQAATIARDAFGVVGTTTELGSQQDQNFRLDSDTGSFVLKVANGAFSREELDLQNRAMEHLATQLVERVPLPIRALDGREIVEVDGSDTRLRVRLFSFIEGAPLRRFAYLAPSVLRATGDLAARIAHTLQGFRHPADDRRLQWDLRVAAEVVAALAPEVRDPRRRAMVERTIEQAAKALTGFLPELRLQVIHGDVNDWNILAQRDDSGRPVPVAIIDFGDLSLSWTAAECAILASSATEHAPERPLQTAREVVRGFHARLPLKEAEVAALPALIAARAAVSAVSCDQQVTLQQGTEYAVDALQSGWTRLEAIAKVPFELGRSVFREACGMPLRRPRLAPTARAPLLPDARGPHLVDLSVTTDAFAFGSWRDPEAIKQALGGSDDHVSIGRMGEARLVHDEGPQLHEPATVDLGIDVFAEETTPVAAPIAGEVTRVEARELTIVLDDGVLLHVAEVDPSVTAGTRVRPGDGLGRVARPPDGARLPAHVHVQLTDAGEVPPALVPASLAVAWSSLSLDPAPLLGIQASPVGSETGETLARRRRFVAASQVLYYPDEPPRIERGWRQWLYDVHGRPYLDVVNNVAVVGHSHPRIEAAARRQLRRLNTNTRFLYDAMGRLAERLASLVPDPLGAVFFVNSGSEANELALRLAREVTGRQHVVCLDGSYHGWTGATNELLQPRDERVLQLAKPNPYTGKYRSEASAATLYADEAVAAVRARAEAGGPPAAFICEPYLGNSGGVTLPDGYLEAVYGATRETGGICIADEVQVGYGRLGRYFWAFEQQNVVPDVVTIAKATGNGHPLAAVITTPELADRFAERTEIFSSVGGTPVSCEVGLAVLDVIEDEALQENARHVGDHLTERLLPLVGSHANVGALHGIGLYRGIELVQDPETREPAPQLATAICERMLSLGIVVQPTGKHANILKLKPPLCVTCADIDFLAEAFELTLRDGW